jgi:uncharacterized protein
MNQKLKILIQMQELDDVIGEKDILTRELPQELSSMKQNLEDANNQLEETSQLLDENIKTQKLKELEIRSNKDKIDKYKNQLLTIQTNKEYKALNSEVSHLESLNTGIDDDLIEMMEEEAKIRTELDEKKAIQKKADDLLKANEEILKKKIDAVEKEIVVVRDKRNSLAKGLSTTMVRRYAALIKNKNRKAVVFDVNGTCSGCHYKIRPQLIIEIREAEKVLNCESCGRMIVAKPFE